MKKISIKAPCRIDLAGGTIDLWPLYLYFGGHTLCHMAIDIYTQVTLRYEKTDSKNLKTIIYSIDLDEHRIYKSTKELVVSLGKNTEKEPTRWINRLLVDFVNNFLSSKKITGVLSVECKSMAPPGSGLGGSSVLGVALWTALEKMFCDKNKISDKWDIQKRVRDLEAVEIEHPAGDQDYVPALFGGLLLFNLSHNHRSVKKVENKTADKLSERLALVYTGVRHHSGINNWELFTNFHKWGHPCRDHLRKIHQISELMSKELENGRLNKFADLLNKEWSSRKLLGESVNAPALQSAWNFAKRHGASARKACGAGGGGCLLVYFPNKSKRNNFLKQQNSLGFTLFPINLATKGAH